ncbi:putative GPI anchored protein [Aspergillus thermomutatus]|uniref:GPI anchored protein n=1 Tax=Aspergillus thermomutatus TaxID=41047 RepID=A0A397GZP7_ASPTH|nr:uncharacterized protein CDV56_105012 [Aspergillus thermomutatus]RHZ54503.1 hypothetical protein CDV56_105012 [Aspergillus thermomutatus]
MRPLQFLALSGLMLASNISLAAELERDDVPNRCWDVCGPVVGIAQKCDNMHRDNDRAEMMCICDWNQASTLVPLCEACIAQYRSDIRNNNDHDDDRDEIHDNDAYDILTSCSLSTTTYNAAAATSILSTATGTTRTTATNSASTTQSSSGSSSTGSTSTTGNSQSSSNTNTGSNAQATNNAVAASAVPKAASVAAVVGLIGLAWL